MKLVPLRATAAALLVLGLGPLALIPLLGMNNSWWPDGFPRWILTAPAETIAICLVCALVLGEQVDTLVDRSRALLLAPSPRLFGAFAATAIFVLSAFFSWYCYARGPYVSDEMSQRFQVHLLLDGRLWAVTPHLQEFFDSNQTLTAGGRWFSEFPIGGPILLAIGALLRLGWLVNPALAAWTAYQLYRFAAKITDESIARLTTILFVLSPFVLFKSASELNHVGTLAFAMLAIGALPDWSAADDPARWRRAAIRIGFGVAVVATIRPYDAVLLAIPIAVMQWIALRSAPMRWRSLIWQVAGGIVPLAILLVANWQTTSAPLLFGYDALNGPQHRPGFHMDPTGGHFTPLVGLLHMADYFVHLNLYLFEWPIPAVLIIALGLALGRRATRWDYFLVGLLVSVVVGYSAYWFQGFLFGPRFLYIALPALLLFAARMPSVTAARFTAPVARRATLLLMPVCLVTAWVPVGGTRGFAGVWARAAVIRKSDSQVAYDIGGEVAAAGLTNALVFVHETWREQLSARLRALGEPAMTAETIAADGDACALQEALDADDSLAAGTLHERLVRVVGRVNAAGPAEPVPGLISFSSLALAGGKPSTPACAKRLQAELTAPSKTPLDLFLPFDDFDGAGRLNGPVIFARDMGSRNELLRAEYGGRHWYWYRPPTGPDDRGAVFIPYTAPPL